MADRRKYLALVEFDVSNEATRQEVIEFFQELGGAGDADIRI